MYNNKNLRAAPLFLLIAATAGFAYPCYYQNNPGPLYIGGQIGVSDNHERSSSLFSSDFSTNDTGVAGRVFFGWNLSPYASVEWGITQYSNTVIKNDYAEMEYSQLSSDCVAKFNLPVRPGFKFYIKTGIAAVEQYDFKVRDQYDLVNIDSCDEYIRPIIGAGFNCNINRQVAIDVGGYHIFQKDNLQNVDFVGLGLLYRFRAR